MTTLVELVCINCKHYNWEKSLEDEDGKYYCPAYPDGIPMEIEDGTDNHAKERPDQVEGYVFESKF